jgi:hypothetical protein
MGRSPLQAMIGDSIEELHTTSSGEGGSGLPSPRNYGMEALLAPATTPLWLEKALATQANTTVPSRVLTPRSNTTPHLSDNVIFGRGNECAPMLNNSTLSTGQRNDKISSPTSKPPPRPSCTSHHRAEVQTKGGAPSARPRPLQPSHQMCYCRPLPVGWIGCTANWQSVPAGTDLTQPLMWFTPGPVGEGPP